MQIREYTVNNNCTVDQQMKKLATKVKHNSFLLTEVYSYVTVTPTGVF